jgi:hypothetical protein
LLLLLKYKVNIFILMLNDYECECEYEYEEPAAEVRIMSDLELCKRAFMNKDHGSFKQQVLSGKFKVYESNYKYSSDYDGANELVVNNRVSGMAQVFGPHRKSCFVAVKCYKQEDKHTFTCYWIANADLKQLLKEDYDDFSWKGIIDYELFDNETNLANYSTFESKFKEETFAFGYVH